jgi:hypothetical protein
MIKKRGNTKRHICCHLQEESSNYTVWGCFSASHSENVTASQVKVDSHHRLRLPLQRLSRRAARRAARQHQLGPVLGWADVSPPGMHSAAEQCGGRGLAPRCRAGWCHLPWGRGRPHRGRPHGALGVGKLRGGVACTKFREARSWRAPPPRSCCRAPWSLVWTRRGQRARRACVWAWGR